MTRSLAPFCITRPSAMQPSVGSQNILAPHASHQSESQEFRSPKSGSVDTEKKVPSPTGSGLYTRPTTAAVSRSHVAEKWQFEHASISIPGLVTEPHSGPVGFSSDIILVVAICRSINPLGNGLGPSHRTWLPHWRLSTLSLTSSKLLFASLSTTTGRATAIPKTFPNFNSRVEQTPLLGPWTLRMGISKSNSTFSAHGRLLFSPKKKGLLLRRKRKRFVGFYSLSPAI